MMKVERKVAKTAAMKGKMMGLSMAAYSAASLVVVTVD